MSEKKIRFRLCAELSDGITPVIVDNIETVIQSIRYWCEEMLLVDGGDEGISIETVLMTDEEVEALPDI